MKLYSKGFITYKNDEGLILVDNYLTSKQAEYRSTMIYKNGHWYAEYDIEDESEAMFIVLKYGLSTVIIPKELPPTFWCGN